MIARSLSASVLICTLASLGTPVRAGQTPTFAAYIVDPKGALVGTATFVGVAGGGVEIHVDTMGLTPGKHGMHIHVNGSCNALRDDKGTVTVFGAAGGHFDPQSTGAHAGPDGKGHAGDLPNLDASDAGHAVTTFFAPRLSVKEGDANNIVGRALVIHANEDNYTDTPPNGGSGARVECGEIGPMRSSAST